jgi:hypothetical protein
MFTECPVWVKMKKRKRADLMGEWVSLNPETGYVEKYTGKYPVFGIGYEQTMFRATVLVMPGHDV